MPMEVVCGQVEAAGERVGMSLCNAVTPYDLKPELQDILRILFYYDHTVVFANDG